jgi:3-hydroxybutyryl-CoA dehydrogenase
MSIQNIAVIGAGTMGNGIAHVFALKGYHVFLIDTEISLLNKAVSTISNNLDRQINKGLIPDADKQNILNNINLIVGIKNTPDSIDFAIEAVFESFELKFQIIKQMKEILKSECILATNTSSVSVTGLSQAYRPEMFIGMHFMNPVPVMQLVEVIRGFSTSNETFQSIKQLSLKLDKTPVEVNDYPGFIANRLLIPMINEAIFALMESVASKEDIDTVMKLGMNHPMGPLALADFIGLDVCLSIIEVLYKGFNDSKYRPCPLLKKMVEANKLGRKTGEGFYVYK